MTTHFRHHRHHHHDPSHNYRYFQLLSALCPYGVAYRPPSQASVLLNLSDSCPFLRNSAVPTDFYSLLTPVCQTDSFLLAHQF
jgi:hypothetical protein